MAVFIIRRFILLVITMVLVSMGVFLLSESSPGNVARTMLGSFVTEEQEASFMAQLGLDKPLALRYVYWFTGSDWHARFKMGLPLKRITSVEGYNEWWAIGEERTLLRWKLQGDDLVTIVRAPDGTTQEIVDNNRWQTDTKGRMYFWGVDNQNHAVRWIKGKDIKAWTYVMGHGWRESSGAPEEYIPLKKGFIRGDPGVSLRTGRPVTKTLVTRLRNSAVLAGITFLFVMPLALVLGIIAGLKEGSLWDRVLSMGSLIFSVTPEFATGIFLILIMARWLQIVPGAAVFGDRAPWERPDMLILPVLTLSFIELGYILRITRASMVEVMKSFYIRTAILKGQSYFKIVINHALRNALMAPITVMMLHVNWLMGGIVLTEVIFGYPGIGKYLLDSAMFNDVNALEATAMFFVMIAVGTQLLADIIYTFLNPRIRYD